MLVIVNGLAYDHEEYPDHMDQIFDLRRIVQGWKDLAFEQTREIFKLRDEIAELKKELAK